MVDEDQVWQRFGAARLEAPESCKLSMSVGTGQGTDWHDGCRSAVVPSARLDERYSAQSHEVRDGEWQRSRCARSGQGTASTDKDNREQAAPGDRTRSVSVRSDQVAHLQWADRNFISCSRFSFCYFTVDRVYLTHLSLARAAAAPARRAAAHTRVALLVAGQS